MNPTPAVMLWLIITSPDPQAVVDNNSRLVLVLEDPRHQQELPQSRRFLGKGDKMPRHNKKRSSNYRGY